MSVRLDLKRLAYFVAVAEELHFGRAAARLGIAQPPLSRQIAQLEADLGALLFDRSRSQVRLTQAGEFLLERAREMLHQADRTVREIARIGEGAAGRLRIAFVGSATHGLLPEIIHAYRIACPEVDLALSTMNNAELQSALVQRQIDVAVARPSLEDDEIRCLVLQTEPLVLALPASAPQAQAPHVALTDLRDETFIIYPRKPRPSFADKVLESCRRAGFLPAGLVEAQDFQTAISLVSVGVGVSMVPKSTADTQRRGVVYRDYDGPNPGTGLSLAVRRDNQSTLVHNFLTLANRNARAVTRDRSPRGST